MPNDLFHERMRFDSMNLNQLETRLQKITDRQKLENFIRISEERKHFSLLNRATEKYKTLFKSLPAYIEIFARLYGEKSAKYDIPKGSLEDLIKYHKMGTPKEIEKALDLVEGVLKGKKKEPEEGVLKGKKKEPEMKLKSPKPVDIVDVIYTKRKLRLE